MFSMPALITMSIAATRMYRSLADFVLDDVYGVHSFNCSWTHSGQCLLSRKGLDNFQITGGTVPNVKWTTSMTIPPNQVEVTVNRDTYERWQSPAQTDPYVSFINIDGQLGDNPRGLNLDHDVESNVEK
jgi:hypothetical protein